MIKTIEGLQNVTILSKEAQKKIKGGKNCSYSWQDDSGKWHTEYGSCAKDYESVSHYESGSFGALFAIVTAPSYCHTQHHTHASPLTSNGGASRC